MEKKEKVACPKCGQKELIIKNGKQGGFQRFKCKTCGTNYVDNESHEDNTEVVEDTRIKSRIEKYEHNKKSYNLDFTNTKESKKYGFSFNSWSEYYLKLHEYKKNQKNIINT